MIELKHVSKVYENGTHALTDVNLRIPKGQFAFLVGASGSGKSTLLKTITREERVSSGTVLINNYNLAKIEKKDIPTFRRTIGVVFQDFRLIPQMTVYDNVAFAMRAVGAPVSDIPLHVSYVLRLVGLEHKVSNYPDELSGGEQQRVALARAIVNNANTLIADEPTGNVDEQMSQDIVQILKQINATGTTILMATHAKELVTNSNERVITLSKGRIVSDTQEQEEQFYVG